ncbi:MAG: tRNA pseudouridine synthase A [Planctomycetota bacterium]|nr:tRNA pseudouridine synthase A [Planctomycetota bacterium]
MPRYRLTLAYDGTDFAGWQKQEPPIPGALPDDSGLIPRAPLRTVQAAVEDAVRLVVRQPVVLIGASRTDSGVHAQAQTAAFTCEGEANRPPDDRIALALTARLPDDIIALRCERTRDDFDPIAGCIAKGYRYRFYVSAVPPLWQRRYVKHVWRPLDPAPMDDAARLLEGEHDFAAFAAAGHGRESTVRTIHRCRVFQADRGPDWREIHLEISGNGFLWNMVRIIAGTLMEVGHARRSPADLARALDSRDRTHAGPTAEAKGLCLMWQRYPEDPPEPNTPALESRPPARP